MNSGRAKRKRDIGTQAGARQHDPRGIDRRLAAQEGIGHRRIAGHAVTVAPAAAPPASGDNTALLLIVASVVVVGAGVFVVLRRK